MDRAAILNLLRNAAADRARGARVEPPPCPDCGPTYPRCLHRDYDGDRRAYRCSRPPARPVRFKDCWLCAGGPLGSPRKERDIDPQKERDIDPCLSSTSGSVSLSADGGTAR